MYKRVLALAPHTDDIELGCGGLISKLKEMSVKIDAVSFSAAQPLSVGNPVQEFKNAMSILNIDGEFLDYKPRYFYEKRQDILDYLWNRNKDNEYDSIIRYNSEIRSFCIFIKAEQQSDITWLQRAEKGKDYFVRFDNTFPLIRRWFDISGANINWETGEQQPKYIFHRGMWEQYFQNDQDQSIPSDSSFVEKWSGYENILGHHISNHS